MKGQGGFSFQGSGRLRINLGESSKETQNIFDGGVFAASSLHLHPDHLTTAEINLES
jgi:hypothetical protein